MIVLFLVLILMNFNNVCSYKGMNYVRFNQGCKYDSMSCISYMNSFEVMKRTTMNLNAIKYEDMANDVGSDENDDAMEEEMARELYDELRGSSKLLSPAQFLAWEDIQDTIEDGLLDTDLLAAILNEVGVKVNDKNNGITFEKFRDLVNLVNTVLEAIENGEEFDDDDGDDDDDDDDDDENVDDIGEDIFTQRFPVK